ncbi:hypothetical protein MZM54_22900 [[Brevibacterium] frigoritolerans]|nr:hypothetical protein [Peribacillus frigoritolerans]
MPNRLDRIPTLLSEWQRNILNEFMPLSLKNGNANEEGLLSAWDPIRTY